MFHTKVFKLDQNTEQENAYLYMALLLFLAFFRLFSALHRLYIYFCYLLSHKLKIFRTRLLRHDHNLLKVL